MKVAYSSIVGQSIMLLAESGACIGQLSVINTNDPQSLADEVVSALNAPNRHAYQVGVAVGKSTTPDLTVVAEAMAEALKEASSTVNSAYEMAYAEWNGHDRRGGKLADKIDDWRAKQRAALAKYNAVREGGPAPFENPPPEHLMQVVDTVLHDMGNPQPKESKQWLREFLEAGMRAVKEGK